MTLKQFRWVKIVVAMVVAMAVSQAVMADNYWLVAVAVSLSALAILWLRRQVKEIVADERDYEIAGRSARYAMTAFTVFGAVLSLVFMAWRDNQLYATIGSVVAYTVCAYMMLYSLIFTYLSRPMSRGRKIWFWVAVFFLAAFFAVGSLRLFSGDEDTWLCQDGQWIKHGQPSAPQPESECQK